jgi:hypothetical protein
MSSLYHSIPFQTLHIAQLFYYIEAEPVRMRIRGNGTIDHSSGKDVFVLLETTLCQAPQDLHAIVIPSDFPIGEAMVLSRGENGTGVLTIEQGEGKVTYKKNKFGFEKV